MALRFPFRVKATSTTTGTGTYTITEPASQAGYRSFTKAVSQNDLADGDSVPYVVVDSTVTNGTNLFELCVGVWNNTAKTLTRATIYQPGAAPVSWGVGQRDILVVDNPVMFLLLAGGTMTGLLNILISGSIITPAAETSLLVQRSTIASTDAGGSIIAGTTGKSRLNLGHTSDEKSGGFVYDNNLKLLTFRTNGTDGPKITSTQVLQTGASVPYDALPGGGVTFVPFRQAAAPPDWTKSTADNDKAFRIVSGTGGGSGGSRALSAATVGGKVLGITEIPSHRHPTGTTTVSISGAVAALIQGTSGSFTGYVGGSGGSDGDPAASHDHALALAYIDLIICSKN